MAAVLAVGESAVLSHFSAALLWELIDRAPPSIHVLVPGQGTRRRSGLVIHRTRHLPPEHRIERSGIPVTTVGRTLLDLAAMLPPKRLRFAVEAADRLGLLDVPALVGFCDTSAAS
jgi:predicted transcriptional regulator of viral defense system